MNTEEELTCAACGNLSQSTLCESCQDAEDRRKEAEHLDRDHR